VTRRRQHHGPGERGAVAGLEGLAFGVLVLLTGTLLIVNAWAVVDTRIALDAAAEEYLRAYTEAGDARAAAAAGEEAARSSLAARGVATPVLITAPDPAAFGPCTSAHVEIEATVPAARLPFVGGLGTTHLHVRHDELVDAHREVVGGDDLADTACG
jgi:hypothetical protein